MKSFRIEGDKHDEFIDRVINTLKRGWTQNRYVRHAGTDKACYCLLGAMNWSTGAEPDITPWGNAAYYYEYWDLQRALTEVIDHDSIGTIADYNDNYAVDVTQVIDVLNQARSLIKTQGYKTLNQEVY